MTHQLTVVPEVQALHRKGRLMSEAMSGLDRGLRFDITSGEVRLEARSAAESMTVMMTSTAPIADASALNMIGDVPWKTTSERDICIQTLIKVIHHTLP